MGSWNIPGGLLSDFVSRGGSHYRMLLQCCLTAASAPLLLVFPLTHSLAAILRSVRTSARQWARILRKLKGSPYRSLYSRVSLRGQRIGRRLVKP